MYTKYMFNNLVYNPAYAGSKGYMSMSLLHRSQWLGVDGGPFAQTFTLHAPLDIYDRVAYGLTIVNQHIGVHRSTGANVAYAYRIRMGGGENQTTLSVGFNGGMTYWRADMRNIDVFDVNDEAFAEERPKFWIPTVGFGVFLYSKYFFAGFSSPNMIESDLRRGESVTTDQYARVTRHYYWTAGGAIPLKGDDIVLRPMILFKNAGLLSKMKNEDDPFRNYGSPTEFDVDISIFLRQALWIGSAFRSAIQKFDGSSSFDSVDLWAAYYLRNGMSIGVAYDYTLTELQKPARASFEVMLGYDFAYRKSNTYSPRYF